MQSEITQAPRQVLMLLTPFDAVRHFLVMSEAVIIRQLTRIGICYDVISLQLME
jgi:hypothetical protein